MGRRSTREVSVEVGDCCRDAGKVADCGPGGGRLESAEHRQVHFERDRCPGRGRPTRICRPASAQDLTRRLGALSASKGAHRYGHRLNRVGGGVNGAHAEAAESGCLLKASQQIRDEDLSRGDHWLGVIQRRSKLAVDEKAANGAVPGA